MTGKTSQQCTATTRAGARCKRRAAKGTDYCSVHTVTQEVNHAELRGEYDNVVPVLSRFAESLKEQLLTLIQENNLTLGVPIEQRVKTWESIAEKLKRKNANIDAIQELDDLVGLRLILLFNRDLHGIDHLLKDRFTILSHEDTATRLEETQFGYQSVHYIVSFPDDWLSVPTMTEFNGLKAELQVRTLAQHIWAAASHKLQYKREVSVPLPLRRSIHRVSAILETVDLEFERLLQERDAYVSGLSTTTDDSRLNVDIVLRILRSKWPMQNEEDGELLSDLVRDLAAFEIETSSQLVRLIDEHYEEVMKREKKTVKRHQKELEETGQVSGTTEERILAGVFFTFVGLTRNALSCKSPQQWSDYQAKYWRK